MFGLHSNSNHLIKLRDRISAAIDSGDYKNIHNAFYRLRQFCQVHSHILFVAIRHYKGEMYDSFRDGAGGSVSTFRGLSKEQAERQFSFLDQIDAVLNEMAHDIKASKGRGVFENVERSRRLLDRCSPNIDHIHSMSARLSDFFIGLIHDVRKLIKSFKDYLDVLEKIEDKLKEST